MIPNTKAEQDPFMNEKKRYEEYAENIIDDLLSIEPDDHNMYFTKQNAIYVIEKQIDTLSNRNGSRVESMYYFNGQWIDLLDSIEYLKTKQIGRNDR